MARAGRRGAGWRWALALLGLAATLGASPTSGRHWPVPYKPGEPPPWDKQDHLVGPLLPGGADSGPEKLIGVFDVAEFRQPVGGDLVGERESVDIKKWREPPLLKTNVLHKSEHDEGWHGLPGSSWF